MTASVNGKDLLGAVITETVTGNWTAELEVDSDDALSGRVTIDIDGVVWLGSVARASLEEGRVHAFCVGGNGALGQELAARHYLTSSMATHLRDILSPGGETLSATTDAALIHTSMPRWSRRRGTIGMLVAQVARDSDANWRVLRDGSVWLGHESWPAAKTAEWDELERVPGRLVLSTEAPVVVPGSSLEGKNIVGVVTTLGPEALTQDITFADPDSVLDRAKRFMTGILESLIGHRLDYGAWYPSVVIGQSADLETLELYPDSAVIRGQGIARVPLRHGLPGCKVQVTPGSRVILFFEDSDPQQPAAGLWPTGSGVLSLSIESTVALTLKAPIINVQGNLAVTGNVSAAGIAASGALSAASVSAASVSAAGVSLAGHTHATAGTGTPSGPIPFP